MNNISSDSLMFIHRLSYKPVEILSALVLIASASTPGRKEVELLKGLESRLAPCI